MAIAGDSGSRAPDRPSPDLWKLPEIETLRIDRVRYKKPRKHTVAGRLVEHDEAIEILVKTKGDIPVRALSPALDIGATQVVENEVAGEMTLRFFVTDEAALRDGAPITLGWAGQAPPRGKAKFQYRKPTEVVER